MKLRVELLNDDMTPVRETIYNIGDEKITLEAVEAFILDKQFKTIIIGNKPVTQLTYILANNFRGVLTTSSVSAKNYDATIGEEVLTKQLHDMVWQLLGSALGMA